MLIITNLASSCVLKSGTGISPCANNLNDISPCVNSLNDISLCASNLNGFSPCATSSVTNVSQDMLTSC